MPTFNRMYSSYTEAKHIIRRRVGLQGSNVSVGTTLQNRTIALPKPLFDVTEQRYFETLPVHSGSIYGEIK